MRVEQLFVETLIDINQKLASNPANTSWRVSGLLRQILIDKKPLLEPASAAASLEPKFRLVKPGPPPIPPDVQRQIDDAWDKYIASLLPDAPVPQKVSIAFSMRGDLLSGIASQPGDKVLELAKKDFLSYPIVTWMDKDYTVENVLRVAANSLGGVHLSETNHDPPSQELRDYMEGSQMLAGPCPPGTCSTLPSAHCGLVSRWQTNWPHSACIPLRLVNGSCLPRPPRTQER